MSKVLDAAAAHVDVGDDGFSLIELVVTLAVLLVVFGITFGLIVALQEQQQNVSATINGAQQAQLSSEEVLQFIRSAYAVTSISASSSSDSFTLDSFIGTSQGALTPNDGQVTVTYTKGSGAVFGTGTLTTSVRGLTGTPPSTTKSVNSFVTQKVLAPNGSPFVFLGYVTGQLPATVQMTSPGSCPGDIAAIELNLTFFAGPAKISSPGALPDLATTLNSEVFLRNAGSAAGVTAQGACPS